MDNEIFEWIGVFAFPIAIIALLFAFSSGVTYNFNETQFITNGTNISINSSILGNNSYYNNTYINQTVNATVNTTQFDYNNPIHMKESWLESFIESISKWTNYFLKGENLDIQNKNITNISVIQINNVTGACLDISGISKNSTHYCFS